MIDEQKASTAESVTLATPKYTLEEMEIDRQALTAMQERWKGISFGVGYHIGNAVDKIDEYVTVIKAVR